MPDEATLRLQEMIQNLEVGYHFLREQLNVDTKPHVYWPIDVFGHSAITPALLSKYGYDTIFLSRIGSTRKQRMVEQSEKEAD